MTDDETIRRLFMEAMTSLASGVAVVTTRRPDGEPCGLLVTSITSYSSHPPSLLVSIGHASRCHQALAGCERFGVHLLRAGEIELARLFADSGAQQRFDALEWRWDDHVPELAGTLAYLRCRRVESFSRYDHTVLIGDIEAGRAGTGDPLLYARRRMDWLLQLDDGPAA